MLSSSDRFRSGASLAIWAAVLITAAATPVAAMLPQVQGTPSSPVNSAPAPAPAIEADRNTGSDQLIAQRISAIFAEVPSLARVTVKVDQGVVTLGGTVTSAEAQQRAEAIATRVVGVVTVENTIERDVSVDNGLGLGGLDARVQGFTRILPLVGVAILVGLLIAGLGYLIASLTGLWRRIAPNLFLADLIASAIRFVFVVGGLVIALDMIGAGALLGAVLGGAGVIGIALGFAMRDTIENYVASLMLSLRQPFRPNDWVLIDDREGRVIRLTSRATILMTLDGNHLRIPNSTVFKAVILNYTRNPQRRFEFKLGIDSDDDPDAGRALGRKVLGSMAFVLADPPPKARVVEVGDSNVVLQFLAWIDQRETDWFEARSRAIAKVKAELEAAGFALPEPIYRLRFDSGAVPKLEASEQTGATLAPSGSVAASRTVAAEPSAPSAALHEDVKPDNEIARMVADERADAPGEKDLLDPARPVE